MSMLTLEHDKIQHDVHAVATDNLSWYIGLYLGQPRVFLTILRKKVVHSPAVQSVLIPLYTVQDPITNKKISINITDRYFFVGCSQTIYSEDCIGLQAHANTIMLLRGEDGALAKIAPTEIKNVIHTHVQKRKLTIQQDITVHITAGTFKDWYGVVEGTSENKENTFVRFTSDDYEYTAEMPTVLCKIA